MSAYTRDTQFTVEALLSQILLAGVGNASRRGIALSVDTALLVLILSRLEMHILRQHHRLKFIEGQSIIRISRNVLVLNLCFLRHAGAYKDRDGVGLSGLDHAGQLAHGADRRGDSARQFRIELSYVINKSRAAGGRLQFACFQCFSPFLRL